VFLAIAYALEIALALALPRAGIVTLISILVPVIAVTITVLVMLPRGRRRAAWAEVGFGRPPWRAILVGVVGSMAILTLSYAIAAAVGVVRFTAPDGGIGGWALELVLTLVVFGVVLLGEEIGWRGFLLLRFGAVMSARRAVLATGACQAAFHLPLLTLTTTYQSEGSRWIVVPMVMATLTLAGVWYGWLRLWSGSIWPVTYAHSAFNSVLQGGPRVVIGTSPAAMAYTTTETGVVTLLIVLVTAVYLLTQRAADFRIPGR
jgi:membrane protease YdiL (CAAX protease family)